MDSGEKTKDLNQIEDKFPAEGKLSGENVGIQINCIKYNSFRSENDNVVRKISSSLEKDESESKSIWKKIVGFILAVVSTLMFSLNALTIKIGPSDVHILNICSWGFLLGGFLSLPIVLFRTGCKKKDHLENVIFPLHENYKIIFLICLRSAAGSSAFVLQYFSLKYLPLGDSTVIIYSGTIFVYIFSWLLLREDMDVIIIATGILAVAGVAVIARPPLLSGSVEMSIDILIGTLLSCCCMVLISTSIIATRFVNNVHYSILTFIFYVWGTVECFLLAAACGVLEVPKNQREGMIIAASGISGFLAQLFLASALRHEQAGHVSLIRTAGILFSFILQFIFLHVVPDILSLVGALMIVSGIVIAVVRKLNVANK